ncbi:MAG: preprotein translocase subunit YajC [Oscillospiraceae bacterium]|jgi:preprotein translocase subunit YajC|nr:preprotein translocase subunit YajC [Oscillospiraceae bacterium]MDE6933101.1 preprotein translocase subunit YajC [Oscillospiraceae bacterium]MDE7042983.1 preprotein translocase subunit YajC [Oscillospiraceae bacterium]
MPLFYTAAGAGSASMMSLMLPLVLMIALMYFLMIRPENKRKKQAEEMRNSLKKGDQITTIGGIIGKIVQVTDETIIIETSDDRVRMELTKWAVSTNNSNPPADAKKGKKTEKEEPAKLEEGSDTETK